MHFDSLILALILVHVRCTHSIEPSKLESKKNSSSFKNDRSGGINVNEINDFIRRNTWKYDGHLQRNNKPFARSRSQPPPSLSQPPPSLPFVASNDPKAEKHSPEANLIIFETFYGSVPTSENSNPIALFELRIRPSNLHLGLYKYGGKVCSLLQAYPTPIFYKMSLLPSEKLREMEPSLVPLKRRAIRFKYLKNYIPEHMQKYFDDPKYYKYLRNADGSLKIGIERKIEQFEYICSENILFNLKGNGERTKIEIPNEKNENEIINQLKVLNSINYEQLDPIRIKDRTLDQKRISNLTWKLDRPRSLIGLPNVGNTCFSNAMVQILMTIQPFISILSSPSILEWCKRNTNSLICEFSKIMKYFYGNDDTAKDKDNSNDINNQEKTKQEEIINTEKQDKEKDQISSPLQLSSTLKNIPRIIESSYRSGITFSAQNDSHELLSIIFDLIDKELSVIFESKYDLMGTLFIGREEQSMACLEKRHCTKVIDSSIPSFQVENGNTLEDILNEYYNKPELLCGSNKYICAACGTNIKVDCGRWTRLESPHPPIVTIHLKLLQQGRKINKNIKFPLELNLTPFTTTKKRNGNETRIENVNNEHYKNSEKDKNIENNQDAHLNEVASIGIHPSTDPSLLIKEQEQEQGNENNQLKEGQGNEINGKNEKSESIPIESNSCCSSMACQEAISVDNQINPSISSSSSPSSIDSVISSSSTSISISNSTLASSASTSTESSESQYELFALIEHIGMGIGGGHYVAYIRIGDSWYYFNDNSTVKKMTEEEVLGRQAYMLFYKMKGLPFVDSPSLLSIPSALIESPLPRKKEENAIIDNPSNVDSASSNPILNALIGKNDEIIEKGKEEEKKEKEIKSRDIEKNENVADVETDNIDWTSIPDIMGSNIQDYDAIKESDIIIDTNDFLNMRENNEGLGNEGKDGNEKLKKGNSKIDEILLGYL